jgi:hypothetical protein
MTIRPSRPAAIRYIVHNYLLKAEQAAKRRREGKLRSRPIDGGILAIRVRRQHHHSGPQVRVWCAT